MTGRKLGLLVALCLLAARLSAMESLEDVSRRFRGTATPVRMTYDITYRFLGMELGYLGRMDLISTIGTWKHSRTGTDVPAVFVDIRVRSKDHLRGAGGRTRINDRMVAVLELPDMNAMLFAKEMDEQLNPVFGRTSVSRAVSCYDAQGGTMEYCKRDLITGVVSTNLTAPEALYRLTRQVGDILTFLELHYRGEPQERIPADAGTIAVNLDGRVVRIRLVAERGRSPSCMDCYRFDSLYIRTVMEKGAPVRSRDFQAWGMPFSELAGKVGDPALEAAARQAPVDALVPLVMDYELALGAVRVVLVESVARESAVASLPDGKGPEPVSQENAAAGNGFRGQLGSKGRDSEPVVEEPDKRL